MKAFSVYSVFLFSPWQYDENESWNQDTLLFYCWCHMRQILPEWSSISRWDLRNLFNDHKLEASYCDSQHSAIWKDVKAAVQGRPIQSVAADKNTFGTLTGILNPKSSFTLDLWFWMVKQRKLEKEIWTLKWFTFDPKFKPGIYSMIKKNLRTVEDGEFKRNIVWKTKISSDTYS